MHVHHVHATWSMGPSVEPMLWTSNRKHILYARDTHLTTCAQLIEVLSHANMPRRLAAARTAFAAAFPLSEPLWAAWLEAAVGQVASGDMDAEELLRLAQRATQDYLSCNLWQTYLSCAPAVGAELFMCSCALRCYAVLCYAALVMDAWLPLTNTIVVCWQGSKRQHLLMSMQPTLAPCRLEPVLCYPHTCNQITLDAEWTRAHHAGSWPRWRPSDFVAQLLPPSTQQARTQQTAQRCIKRSCSLSARLHSKRSSSMALAARRPPQLCALQACSLAGFEISHSLAGLC